MSGMVRPLAWSALAAQVVFVASWLIAGLWQGSGYSALSQTISDMYAVTAPRGMFLVVVITLCGLATVLFALFSLWPVLRPAGWTAAVGSVLLALSIYGLGDLLTPFEREACRIADSGCSPKDQLANSGGTLDAILSTLGIFLFIAAAFFLAAAMKRTPGWQDWARPARWVGVIFFLVLVVLAVSGGAGLDGLMERVLATFGAAAIAAVAARISTAGRT
jgi:hypothetical protein